MFLTFDRNGQPSPCGAERTAKSISDFVTHKLAELNEAGKSKVHVLTAATFNNTLKDIDAIVEFYAPWCGHCKQLAPKFEEAAETASEVFFGKVNCDLNPDVCHHYNVEGYPSIQFIRCVLVLPFHDYLTPACSNLKGTPYQGDRSVADMVQFARGKAEEFKSSAVLDLGQKDFDDAIKLNSKILVEFYAPWCGHCKQLAPEYEKAAQELKGKVPIAKVDCTAHNDVCTAHNVQGYPTIKYFEDGVPTDYNGERVSAAIVAFLRKKILGPVTDITTEEQLDDVEAAAPAIIGYFDSKEDGMHDTFQQVAKGPAFAAFTIGAGTNGELAKKYAKKLPSIRFVRGEDVGEDLWWENTHFKGFEEWIKANEFALIGEIGPASFKKYVDSGKDLIAVFLDPSKKKEALELTKPIAAEFANKFNFGWSDGVQWKAVVERWLGHAADTLPVVVYLNFADDWQKGLESYDAAKFHAFVKSLADGTVQHTPKTEAVPTEQGDVFVAVGTTLSEVINQKKDVLVEFYAPWCGHCQSLAPIYDKLAAGLKEVSSIVIAKIDATANDVKHIVGKNTVQGFPTILFYPADNKTPTGVNFNGDRTLKGFVEFLRT